LILPIILLVVVGIITVVILTTKKSESYKHKSNQQEQMIQHQQRGQMKQSQPQSQPEPQPQTQPEPQPQTQPQSQPEPEPQQQASQQISKNIKIILDKLNQEIPGIQWIKTNSGMFYFYSRNGSNGQKPHKTSNVKVNYEGKLLDNGEWKIFDSSYKRGEPISFQLDKVIPGWTEIVQLMNKGDEIIVVIPSELAYGGNSVGDLIKPNQTLLFKIELIDFVG
jgi:FKBP-type peptidyl-prolyl cis-trans isomerase FklB